MRKRFRVPLFAAFVGAVVAPVGFALSLESSSSSTAIADADRATPLAATTIMRTPSPSAEEPLVPDAAKLLAVGATLLAAAAFVRKAS